MISVSCVTKDGILSHLDILGHGIGKNSIEICAGISCLSRTVCEIVTRLDGVVSNYTTTGPGNIVLDIHKYEDTLEGRMLGITDFFLFGILGIVTDYPNAVKLKINYKEWYDGSQERWW